MADGGSVNSPRNNYRGPISSFFSSPRLFTGFVSKGFTETESFTSSPSSVLDFTSFVSPKNPFCSEAKSVKRKNLGVGEKIGSRGPGLGLGLADVLFDEKSDSNFVSKLNRPMILFGSQLKIQVATQDPAPVSLSESPPSPGDFGIKTRPIGTHVGSLSSSPSPVQKSPFGSSNSIAFGVLSPSEMELSEDYTCVISYGPNPRTTHIFDDCIVESCCGVVKLSESRKENGLFSNWPKSYPSESFLSFCYSCRKNLGQGTDIYMYRGEKAFCSSDCRYKEMMPEGEGEGEEELGNSLSDDIFSDYGQVS